MSGAAAPVRDFKHTLCLPRTDFPAEGGHPEQEAEHSSHPVYVALTAGPEVVQRLPALAGQPVALLVETAAPWALPVARELAVNPEYEYLFYRLGERVVCVARDRLARVLAEVKEDELAVRTVKLPGGDVQAAALVDAQRIVGYALGEELEGLSYRHVLSEREGRVVLGSHVTLEAGTGLVPPALQGQSLEGLGEGERRIRDTLRYVLGNLYDFKPAEHAVAELLPLDAWARGRLGGVVARVRQAYDAQELRRVYAILVDFCAGELSVYFDIARSRLQTWKATGPGRRSAQTVLYEVARVLMQLLAPVSSIMAEEAWQHLPERPAESVFLAHLPEPWGLESGLAERYGKLLALRGEVQRLLGVERLKARVVLSAGGRAREFLAENLAELPSLLGVSQVELVEAAGERAQTLEVGQVLGEVKAEVLPARGAECARCGTYGEEVERGAEVCPRCQEALEQT